MHLCDWPKAGDAVTTDLEFAMATVRETVRLGLAARGQAKLKVRQPLRAAVVVAAGAEREAIERLANVALEELNVKELRYVSQADELGSYEVKPNYRALGPRFGKSMPQVAAAVAALDPQHVASALRDGGRVGISIDGHDHELGADDLMLAMKPLEGYQLEREGSHAVALELELDDELRREGLAREIVHAIQNARKSAGLQVEDRIALLLGGASELLEAAREHQDYVARETLATSVDVRRRRGRRAGQDRGPPAAHRRHPRLNRVASPRTSPTCGSSACSDKLVASAITCARLLRMEFTGLHHITMITGDAQENARYYGDLLGLRLVKKTVNFDQPQAYHLYFGDETGAPGSILTWFEFPGAARGRAGAGSIHTLQLAVADEAALDFWEQRLDETTREPGVLRFADYDGLKLELVVSDLGNAPLRAQHPEIPEEHAISGLHGVRAYAVFDGVEDAHPHRPPRLHATRAAASTC